MNRIALLGLIALATACGPGAPTPSPSPSTHPISVALDLTGHSDTIKQVGQTGCTGAGGYADIAPGAQFTIKDAGGTLIGFGSFTESHITLASPIHCSLQGTADNVPDAAIYTVEVGRRGAINFTREQLEANGWLAQLTLGN